MMQAVVDYLATHEVDMVAWGSLCLGLLIGGIVAHFIVRLKEFNLGALTGSIGVLSGAGVIGILEWGGATKTESVWFYPVGLLLGATVIALLASRFARDEPAA